VGTAVGIGFVLCRRHPGTMGVRMTTRLIVTLFVTGLATGVSAAAAQVAAPEAAATTSTSLRLAQAGTAPLVVEEDQISPRQIQQENRRRSRTPAATAQAPAATTPAPAPRPRSAAARQQSAAPATPPASGAQSAAPQAAAATPPAAGARPAAARAGSGAPRTIACSGVFGRESTHLKLAMAFDARNVVFTEVDGPEGSKLNATVVFPTDPKRRLEVLWQNEAARADAALIVIGGKSQWSGPKGLRLGMTLAALEKANGKPFSISGLDQENGGSVLDWKGGAMSSLAGGCKVGVRFVVDAKAKDDARAAVAGKELNSSDAALKPAGLAVAEVIFGY
jgi:hypothetical protein